MLTRLNKIINKKLKNTAPEQKRLMQVSRLQEIWREVVYLELNKKAALESRVLFLKRDVLIVACMCSALSQELYFLQTKIISEINQKMGRRLIKRLEFKVG